jgi:hypothetical protein
MRILGIAVLGAALGISAGSTSSSAYYCSEPSASACATRYGAFDDEDDFDQCKRKMSDFKSEVETFLSCVQREAERVRNDYNGTVESFNRRARG